MNARLTLTIKQENIYFSTFCMLKIDDRKVHIDFVHGFMDQKLLTSIALSENKLFILNKIDCEQNPYDEWLPITNLTYQKSRAFIRFDNMLIIILPGRLRIKVDENGVTVRARCFVAYDDRKSLQTVLEINCFLVEK